MPTAFILTRYSTDNQNPDTTAVQVKKCAEYCRQNQLSILDIFSDEAVSGMRQHRPEYDRMMAQYRAGTGADVVVIYDQSRMFRDMVEWFTFRRELQALGARVISVTQPLVGGDLMDPSVFINEGAMALFNQMHVLVTRQKVVEKMRFMAGQGRACGGTPPLGYDVDAEKRYIINEHEAETVREIFYMHAAGASYGEIITTLAAEGRTTKSGRPFGKNSLHDILKNEKYIGRLIYGAVPRAHGGAKRNSHTKSADTMLVVENAVPRIISDELWEKVQGRMKTRKGEGGRHSAKNEYLLAGKVFCGECGGAMVVTGCNQSKDGRQYRYYNCVNKRQTKTCSAKGIGVGTLEQQVAAAVKQQLGTAEAAGRIISAAISYRDKIKKGAAPKSSAIDAELKNVDKKISNLVDAIAGGMNSEAVAERLTELEERKAQLTASKRMLQSAEEQVGLTNQQIREAVDKLATANWESPTGLRTLLSVVLRVNVYADHLEVFTIFGGDGNDRDMKTAAKAFITSIGSAPPAPESKQQMPSAFCRWHLSYGPAFSPNTEGEIMNRQEPAVFTNMCMICDGAGNVLVQNRLDPDWPGITFPGGHVERGESFTDAVIREVREETGLTVSQLRLCGVKDWIQEDGSRYLVLLYRTHTFRGELVSSPEGDVFWVPLADLPRLPLAEGMQNTLRVFCEETLSEQFLDREDDWRSLLK